VYGPCFSSIVGGHPLRSPTRRCLGRPLPYQLADGTQAPPKANKSFRHRFLNPMTTSGISPTFAGLSQTSGQVTNALLTRSPLGHPRTNTKSLVRLACIRHAASVHPEPGSNSPQKIHSFEWILRSFTGLTEVVASYHFSVVKVLFLKRAAFYSRHTNLSRVLTDESADALRIGSSDCETNRFVSLT
jgi:hypothetical protein